jgi:hypothetical protein
MGGGSSANFSDGLVGGAAAAGLRPDAGHGDFLTDTEIELALAWEQQKDKTASQ